MKVDLTIPIHGQVDCREAVRQAERDGYDGAWTSEIKHDPFVSLALAATATDRIELGTAIALAFARNPMSVAVLGNDLQELSGGRVMLGLGTQVKAHITRRFGMPWSQPARRMREYVLALRAIWDCWAQGTPLEFRGEFYTHTLMTPMFVPGRHSFGPPRVLLAGVGVAMTEIAGEVADGFLCHGFTTERYLREVTLPALLRGREKAGRTAEGFEITGSTMLVVGRTDEELARASDGARRQIAFYGSTPAYRPVLELHGRGELGDRLHTLSRAGEWAEMGRLIDDELLHAVAIVGRPDEVATRLHEAYGDVLTRISLYTPYDIDPSLSTELAVAVRAAG
ncbi:LLM class F420-dependent oxidoreductase [Amycolatopsis acidiphila]|uniref:LLM class F420-dependent oxidoreductase n=1 Tax=Amycolatopsis acidiphila TaxID=715473 RepID=A0A557ZZK9_9PSEU|nr:LLM class F420-dependent oxidoreductase [Amycolatopsis acidiphila]TVT17434.1 LLM class F420-dependent oxidoreductase [Amycolatopsis acidiphila]UIJ57282.1 LLM class F420-dependent oxidoreductase [Amycolatopsis acidiphila]GHG52298.1 LLM class F420-dependent oxidoreductase [Amycolatopsis acidiphila]